MSRWIPTGITLALIAAMLAYGPVHQPTDYHAFADRRAVFGIANALDVLSNIGFTLVGLWGLAAWFAWRRMPGVPLLARGYAMFFSALVLTGFGSAYYHLAPDDARLVWDRLPIALACAGLLAAVQADTSAPKQPLAIPVALAVAAIASVGWWAHTVARGQGDLRPYLLVQFLPLLLIPVWQAIYRTPRRHRIAFGAAIGLYVLAKVAELADRTLFDSMGLVSGHTLKHLFASAAGWVLAADFWRRYRAARAPSSAAARVPPA